MENSSRKRPDRRCFAIVIKRVPETMPPDVARKNGAKLDQAAPVIAKRVLDASIASQ
jgi:hypothetical protein